MTLRITLFFSLLVLFSDTMAASAPEAQNRPERLVLSNGVTLLLHPIPGAAQVAVEAIYDAGSLHEPPGMTQASLLLSHLLSSSNSNKTAGLNDLSAGDALFSFAHYDSVGETNALERLLQSEAQRLATLQITTNLVQLGASQCYAEADSAQRNSRSGMLKQGFMALNQSWHWRSNHVRLRSGLEKLTPSQLTRVQQDLYKPSRLILVIMGGFRTDQAALLCQKWFENLPPDSRESNSIDWTRVSGENVCLWDTGAKAFCLAVPPPPQKTDQILLTLWATVLHPKLANDPDLSLLADFVFCPNQIWAVGPLPFFVYATPKTNISLLSLQRMVQAKTTEFVNQKPSNSEMAQLRKAAGELNKNHNYTWAEIEFQARVLGRQLQKDTSETTGQVLANFALQLGLRDLLLQGAPAALATIQKMTADELHAFLRAFFNPETRLSTILLPEELGI